MYAMYPTGGMATVKKPLGKQIDDQGKQFVDAARSLECDESEERFDAALKKVAAHKPLKDREDGGAKGDAKPSKETR
jgi:hypothetical protein